MTRTQLGATIVGALCAFAVMMGAMHPPAIFHDVLVYHEKGNVQYRCSTADLQYVRWTGYGIGQFAGCIELSTDHAVYPSTYPLEDYIIALHPVRPATECRFAANSFDNDHTSSVVDCRSYRN